MSIPTILFDLDGTLLPMDQKKFAKAYVRGLTFAAEPAGCSPVFLASTVLAGTSAMVKNNIDISVYPHGKMADLLEFIDTLK